MFNFLKSKSVLVPIVLSTSLWKFNFLRAAEPRTFTLPLDFQVSEGEVKEFKFGPQDHESVIIARVDGKLHCVSSLCPHAGAPLIKGLSTATSLKCPWHAASFDIASGETDVGPSLNDLEKFDILEIDGKLTVKIPSDYKNKGKVRQMAKRDLSNLNHFVILGGGPAALAAAETLRYEGYTVYF